LFIEASTVRLRDRDRAKASKFSAASQRRVHGCMLLCEIRATRAAVQRLQRRGASNRLAGDRNPDQRLAENA
jgi:hypothetical protein